MKKYEHKKETIVFSFFLMCVIVSILSFFWPAVTIDSSKETAGYFDSIEAAILSENLTKKDQVIFEKDFEGIAYVLIDNEDSLRTINYEAVKKRNKTVYKKIEDFTIEKFFLQPTVYLDETELKGRLSLGYNSPKIIRKRMRTIMQVTTEKKETEIKVNNNKASEQVEYEKNGVTYYFLFFSAIDYSEEAIISY